MTGRSALNKFTLLALLLSAFFVTQNGFSKPTYGIAFGYVPGYTSSTSGYVMNVSDIPWSDLSHVSFFVVTITGTTPVISDPLGLHAALIAQAHAQSPKVRCYMTVGGATQTVWPTTNANCITLADNIANMMTEPVKRPKPRRPFIPNRISDTPLREWPGCILRLLPATSSAGIRHRGLLHFARLHKAFVCRAHTSWTRPTARPHVSGSHQRL